MSHGNLRTPVRFGLVLLLVLAVMVSPTTASRAQLPENAIAPRDAHHYVPGTFTGRDYARRAFYRQQQERVIA